MSKNALLVSVVSAAAMLGGCAMQCPVERVKNSPPEAQPQNALIIDQAMQARDWQRASANYANGNVLAGPTGFLFAPNEKAPDWEYGLIESPLFVGQTVGLPITLTLTPPWTPVLYSGATVEPTYTAVPALPRTQSRRMVATPSTQP